MSKKEEGKEKHTEKGKEIDGLMDRQSVLLSQQSVMGRFNNWKEQYVKKINNFK